MYSTLNATNHNGACVWLRTDVGNGRMEPRDHIASLGTCHCERQRQICVETHAHQPGRWAAVNRSLG